jgi:hypothetical protein
MLPLRPGVGAISADSLIDSLAMERHEKRTVSRPGSRNTTNKVDDGLIQRLRLENDPFLGQ